MQKSKFHKFLPILIDFYKFINYNIQELARNEIVRFPRVK